MPKQKKRLNLQRESVRKLSALEINQVAGGPGHGQTNRCIPFSFPTWCIAMCPTNGDECTGYSYCTCAQGTCYSCDDTCVGGRC